MTKYELVVVLDGSATEEENRALLDKITGLLEGNGAVVESTDVWGKRRLAYMIEKKRDGWYAVIVFDADPVGTALPEVDRFLRITEQVLRHLVTKAVVGKSKGDATKYEEFERGLQQQRAQRMAERQERLDRQSAQREARDSAGSEAPQASAEASAEA